MDKVASDIHTGTQLKHVPSYETSDRADPCIEHVTIHTVDRVAQMQAIKHGAAMRQFESEGAPIHATEVTVDKSAPALERGTKLKLVDRKELIAGVTEPHELKKAETEDKSSPRIAPGTTVGQVDRVAQMQAIRHGAAMLQFESEGAPIHSAELTVDKSGPVIERDTKLKLVDRKELIAGVTEPHELKRAETEDKSSPRIAPGTTVGQIDRVTQMQAIRHGAAMHQFESEGAPIHSTKVTVDKSGPMIERDTKLKLVDRKELIAGVTEPHELKRAETEDKSSPRIETGVTIGQVDRVAQMQTIKHGAAMRQFESEGAPIRATELVEDKSAPAIEWDTKVKLVDRKELIAGVTEPHELKKTETEDKSSPRVAGSVNLVDRVAQMQVIRHGTAMHELKRETRTIEILDKEMNHPTEVRDASAPVIDQGAEIKHIDRKELVAGVMEPRELKKTETSDKSAPVIDKDAKVKQIDRKELLAGVISSH